MPRELIERSTRGARLAAVVAAALATGVVVGVSSLGPGVAELRTVAGGSSAASAESSPGRGHGHDPADKTDKARPDKARPDKARPDKARPDKAKGNHRDEAGAESDVAEGAGGVHGQCVSAVARDKSAVGGPHDNHGWAVSRAAHSCPHPTPVPTAGN